MNQLDESITNFFIIQPTCCRFCHLQVAISQKLENADKKNRTHTKAAALERIGGSRSTRIKKDVLEKRDEGLGGLGGCWAQREGELGSVPKTSEDQNVCCSTKRSLATTTQGGSTPRDKVGFNQSAAVMGCFVAHVWTSVGLLRPRSPTVEGFYSTGEKNTQCLRPHWWLES